MRLAAVRKSLWEQFWELVAWLIDERLWRRRLRAVTGSCVVFVTIRRARHPELLTSALEKAGWAVEADGSTLVAQRRTPWLGGRTSATSRVDGFVHEVLTALAGSGNPPSTEVEVEIPELTPDVVAWQPDWRLPDGLDPASRAGLSRLREEQRQVFAGYTVLAPVAPDVPLPHGVRMRRRWSAADTLRGRSDLDPARLERGRRWFLLVIALLVGTPIALLPPAQGVLADFFVRLRGHITPDVALILLGILIAGLFLSFLARHRFPRVRAATSVVVIGCALLYIVPGFAHQTRQTFPDSASFAWGLAALVPTALAGVLLSKIRAARWRSAIKAALVALVSATGVGWTSQLLGAAYASGLGINGWRAALPFFGLVEAMGRSLLAMLAVATVMGLGVAVMATQLPRIAGILGLATVVVVLCSLALLGLAPYPAGRLLRQGHVADGWEHVIDRACVTVNPDNFPVRPTEEYWVVPGADDRVALVPGHHAMSVDVPILEPRSAVAVQPISDTGSCPVGTP